MRQLDALAATEVMGLKTVIATRDKPVQIGGAAYEDGVYLWTCHDYDGFGVKGGRLPAYSTSISAAWALVEAMDERGWHWAMNSHGDVEMWMGRELLAARETGHQDCFTATNDDRRLALVICCLRACGVPEATIEEAMNDE